jgi:hypothetical protein
MAALPARISSGMPLVADVVSSRVGRETCADALTALSANAMVKEAVNL